MKTVASAPTPEVPGDWEVISLGEECRVENGCPFESIYFNGHAGLPLVRVRDVNSGVSKTLYSGPYEDKYLVANGDLLVGMDGEFHVRKWTAGTALLNQRVCRLVPNTNRLDKGFLDYAIRAPLSHIEAHTPYTTVKHISARQILAIQLPCPPLEEQRQISTVLSAVQRAIERQEQLIALTTELKKALMHKLFTEGTRGEPLKQTEIGTLPQSWEPTPLGACCVIVSSTMSYTDFARSAESLDGDARLCMAVKVSDMNLPGNEAMFVTSKATKRLPATTAMRKLAPPNAVVFPKRGAAIATNKKRMTTAWTVLDPNLIALCAKVALDPRFLFYWSQMFDLRTITDPGPTPQLNKKDLIPVKLPLPSTLEEQQLIAGAIEAVVAKELLQHRTLDSLKELFRMLTHQLMTAQIRVHDLDLSALNDAVQEPVGAHMMFAECNLAYAQVIG
ncbi:MAG TPA: restriction endonuclease subunit S [Thermoanaerobaculia bacterium]